MSSSPALARPTELLTLFASNSNGVSGHIWDAVPLPQTTSSTSERPQIPPPHLFPRSFFTLPPPNAARNTQPWRTLEQYRDSGNDINRALENATVAIQDAQDAFIFTQSRHREVSDHDLMPPPLQSVIDLTSRSPSQSPDPRRRDHARMAPPPRPRSSITALLNAIAPHMDAMRDQASTSRRGTNPPQRLLGSYLDYEHAEPSSSYGSNVSREFGRADGSSNLGVTIIPPRFEEMMNSTPREREQRAIQKQKEARALWESNQRRRDALLSQRSRSRSPRRTSPPVRQRSRSKSRPEPSGSRPNSESPVDSIDLTTVDEKMTTAEILEKQCEDAGPSQQSSSESARSKLTSYKCPICLETPTDATATTCGHVFCHKCIWDVINYLKQKPDPRTEKPTTTGLCPVCRTKLKRIDTDMRGRMLVPMSLMIGAGQLGKRKHDDIKGKGVVRDERKVEESSDEWMRTLLNLEDN